MGGRKILETREKIGEIKKERDTDAEAIDVSRDIKSPHKTRGKKRDRDRNKQIQKEKEREREGVKEADEQRA